MGPLHRVCRAAQCVVYMLCRTAWCCALHCIVCALHLWAVGGTLALHCLAAQGQRAVQLWQRIASPPRGYAHCNSCHALPHHLGAMGSGTFVMHCLTAALQWAVELLQCTTTLPGGSGRCNSYNALPHCLGIGRRNTWHALPRRPGAVGSATPAMHCLTAWAQWAVELLQYSSSPPGLTTSGRWAVELLQCAGPPAGGTRSRAHEAVAAQREKLLQRTASVHGGSGQWNSRNAVPHYLKGVGSETRAGHCHIAQGQWAVEVLQCTAKLPRGSGHCNSHNTLPHCLVAVGSTTPAMHQLTA